MPGQQTGYNQNNSEYRLAPGISIYTVSRFSTSTTSPRHCSQFYLTYSYSEQTKIRKIGCSHFLTCLYFPSVNVIEIHEVGPCRSSLVFLYVVENRDVSQSKTRHGKILYRTFQIPIPCWCRSFDCLLFSSPSTCA